MSLYIGLMSGTSMDGIDAALVEMPSNRLIHGITLKYSDEVHQLLTQLVNEQHISLSTFCQLNVLVGREFVRAIRFLLEESNVAVQAITAIGSHGQTVCHDAMGEIPYTLQLGCPHTISGLTGIDVIADFRMRDLVNGGQGAPFAPLYHRELLSHSNELLALVNVGGIANLTLLVPNSSTTGWDVGPGNCLMDAWINRHQHKKYDAQGDWAAQGKVLPELLQVMLADRFFTKAAPKSIGKEYFSLSWLDRLLPEVYQAQDVQATLLALTASCISNSILDTQLAIKKVYLCGGGTHNTQLHSYLSHLLPNISVASTADLNINPDYLEAMMFAWLASQSINRIPVDLTSITGSQKPAILGAVYPGCI